MLAAEGKSAARRRGESELTVGEERGPLDECVDRLAGHVCEGHLGGEEDRTVNQTVHLEQPLEGLEMPQIAAQSQVLVAPIVHVVVRLWVVLRIGEKSVQLGGASYNGCLGGHQLGVVNVDVEDRGVRHLS